VVIVLMELQVVEQRRRCGVGRWSTRLLQLWLLLFLACSCVSSPPP